MLLKCQGLAQEDGLLAEDSPLSLLISLSMSNARRILGACWLGSCTARTAGTLLGVQQVALFSNMHDEHNTFFGRSNFFF